MWNDDALRESRAPRVHFSGIGGTGMVAVARLALDAGWEVRGSDAPLYPPTSEMVSALGVPVAEGYAAENLDWSPDVVVIGNALSRGNAEVEAALDLRLPYVSFPEWIKEALLRKRRPVAICGTHGKTTTSALTAYLLDRGGIDCGFLIGGNVADFPHSARLGNEGLPFVVEGDEYDTAFFDKRAKFFHYLPQVAVVTSLEFDHADIYANLEDVERAFQRMLRQVPQSGKVLLCADDAGAMSLTPHAPTSVETYGLSPEAHWHGEILETASEGTTLKVVRDGVEQGTLRVPLFGEHNARNVLAAVAVAMNEGVAFDNIAESISRFGGLRRRMEVFIEQDGVVFVDDFAHHPTAIRETIYAARSRWPKKRLTALFEPRSNTTATNLFQSDLADAFALADAVFIGPIHRAERYDDSERLDRELLRDDIMRQGRPAHIEDNILDLIEHLSGTLGNDDVVLLCSNGAFGGIYGLLRERYTQ